MFFANYSFSCSRPISGSPVPMGPVQGPGCPDPYVRLTLHHPRHLLATRCPAWSRRPRCSTDTALSAQPLSPFPQAQLPGLPGPCCPPSLLGWWVPGPASETQSLQEVLGRARFNTVIALSHLSFFFLNP